MTQFITFTRRWNPALVLRTLTQLSLIIATLLSIPLILAQSEVPFKRGDANQDDSFNIGDPISTLLYLFKGTGSVLCIDAADTNDDGELAIADAIYALSFLFLGTEAPPTPFDDCGLDPTADELSCEATTCPPEDPPGPYDQFTANVEVIEQGNFVIIRSDGIPNHSSPYFPSNDPRWEAPHQGMRQNPNSIGEQDLVFRIPLNPQIANSSSDTRLGPIGVAINGVAFFNQFAGPNQPLDREIISFDAGNGHPARGDLYHYHIEPLYLTESNPSKLLGFLLDGFPVYGPRDPDGSLPSDLDECNGHTHATPEFPNGIYHYHIVDVSPYISGCYKGTPGTVSQ